MSTSSIPPRKAPATPYQALHPEQGAVIAPLQPEPAARPAIRAHTPSPAHVPRRQSAAQAEYYAAEASKIETLKNALFSALETSPAGAIPTQLIDLAHTYSSLLKIQLTIMPDPAPAAGIEARSTSTVDSSLPLDPAIAAK